METLAARFLLYSFRDVFFRYERLTSSERSLLDRVQYKALVGWMNERLTRQDYLDAGCDMVQHVAALRELGFEVRA